MTDMSDEKVTDILLWTDIESTGLDYDKDYILEIGVAVTDRSLNIIDSECYVRSFDPNSPMWDRFADAPQIVLDMHKESGLIDDLYKPEECFDDEFIKADIRRFMSENGVDKTTPVCGSSLRLDRNMLDKFALELFNPPSVSYRTIDVSSFKETIRRYEPVIYSGLEGVYAHAIKAHRPLADIEDSIAEYRYYLKSLGML
jgi:oligoribonuclease (3'-5' exoribonuclease)